MPDLVKWALGIIFTLILGAFGYASRIDSSVDHRIEKSENRVVERLDKLEDKIDRLIERR